MTPGAPPAADALTRFVFEHAAVRGAHVALADTTRAVLACHPYPPALARVLSELLAASALLASTLKFTGSLIVLAMCVLGFVFYRQFKDEIGPPREAIRKLLGGEE